MSYNKNFPAQNPSFNDQRHEFGVAVELKNTFVNFLVEDRHTLEEGLLLPPYLNRSKTTPGFSLNL